MKPTCFPEICVGYPRSSGRVLVSRTVSTIPNHLDRIIARLSECAVDSLRQVNASGDRWTTPLQMEVIFPLVDAGEFHYDGIVKRRQTLNIKNPAAHRLAVQLSKQMGVTITDAVIRALENQVSQSKKPIDRKKIDAICARIAALPVLDPRSPDEILGYDEFGVPR